MLLLLSEELNEHGVKMQGMIEAFGSCLVCFYMKTFPVGLISLITLMNVSLSSRCHVKKELWICSEN